LVGGFFKRDTSAGGRNKRKRENYSKGVVGG